MTTPKLTVWYNTKCPVCNRGIDWQRSKLVATVRAGNIAFKDINAQPEALAHYGATLNDVRRRLHATDATGRLIVGGILSKDFPLVQGTVLFVATVYVLINLLVDVAYAYADPRIRLGRA